MNYVVEITGYDLVNEVDVTLRFVMGEGIAFVDAPYAYKGLMKWASATQRIDIDKTGMLGSRMDVGELTIQNAPSHVALPGPWDAIARYAFQRRTASLYLVPGNVWADRILCDRNMLSQPIASLVSATGVESTLRFPLRDHRSGLETPLQWKKYGGTNTAGDGVDGEADLKDKVRPILVGLASNFAGVQVNKDKLIWEVHCGEAIPTCARDGGISIPLGTIRANVASLLTNIPDPGTYDYTATADGTYVRFGTTPVAAVTFDGYSGDLSTVSADRTHAQIWKQLRIDYFGNVSGDLDLDTVDEVDAIDPYEVGWWWSENMTRKQALDTLLASLSGYEVFDDDNLWGLGKLLEPTGTPDLNLVLLQPTVDLEESDRVLIKLEAAQPSYMPEGSPPCAATVRWGKNNRVMSESDFNGFVLTNPTARRLVDKFKEEWRTSRVRDLAIWDPDALTGSFPQAPELVIDTGYQCGVDGLTSPHADVEAERILALYSTMKGQYKADFAPKPGDRLLPGRVIKITYPGFGMASGSLFRILQASFVVQDGKAIASVIAALQSGNPDVVLLMGYDGEADDSQVFTDESAYARVMSPDGNFPLTEVIDTAIKKFGSGSLKNRNASYLSTPAAPELLFGDKPFTIECFAQWDDVSGVFQTNSGLVSHDGQNPGEMSWVMLRTDATHFGIGLSTDGSTHTVIQGLFTPVNNTMYFFRVTRDHLGVVRVFVDGVMIAKASFPAALWEPPGPLRVGAWISGGFIRPLVGYIDEVRVTVGRAWSDSDINFTPPTAKFPR